MTDSRHVPRLVVETTSFDPGEDPLEFSSAADPLAWVRRGAGMIGVGPEEVRIEVHGHREGEPARAAQLSRAWSELSEAAEVRDEVALPGTGLVGFAALAFDDASEQPSTIVVPRTIIGRRDGRGWITRVRNARRPDGDDAGPVRTGYGPHWSATLGPGSLDPVGYQAAVEDALASIRARRFEKVVLARDLVGTVPTGADLRRLVRALATAYPDCWTYAVDGMIGASPETLVTVSHGTVTARVLAGTAARGADADEDTVVSTSLATSAKDLDEHRYAVESVLASLRPATSALVAAEQPFTLKLPNVWHLATDVEGALSDGASALDLVGALHPTAAVAGSPTAAARAAIAELEPFDRGRYAGPVGWIDGDGDGEWAIGLRCAQFGGPAPARGDEPRDIPVTAHAGAGIVDGSIPEAELLETRVKFRPIVDALA